MGATPAVPAIPCRKCGRRLRAGGTAQNAFFPFCSERCRNLDMGKWLDEKYRVPVEDPDTDEDAGPAPEAPPE